MIHVRLHLDQCAGAEIMTVLAAEHHSGPTVGLGVVHIHTRLDQCADAQIMTILGIPVWCWDLDQPHISSLHEHSDRIKA